MANLKVDTKIIAPPNLDIHLVRADELAYRNKFRIFFEVSLSLSSTLLGYILSLSSVEKIHWIFLSVSLLATSAFLIQTFGRSERKSDD